MAIKRFVEAAGKKIDAGYRGEDRIRGTNKVRTYATGAWLYSKESNLDKIIRNHSKTVEKRKKRGVIYDIKFKVYLRRP
jgi:hypothetical protein